MVHSTEGQNWAHSIRDLEGLGGWFNNPGAQASSHVGVDADGYSAKFVDDDLKAWAQAYYNPWSLSIEFVGHAALHDETVPMYRKGAMYVAYWSRLWHIPIRKAAVTTGGRITKAGVIRHSELGRLGGDHHDPGGPFDLARMLDMARHYQEHGW